MPYNDILDLTYDTDDQGNDIPVGKGDKNRLRVIKYYHQHWITSTGNLIENWLSLTWEAYHEYGSEPSPSGPFAPTFF
jgi:hypothetical protein